MKNSNSIFAWLVLLAILFACEKADTKVSFLGGTAPVLTVSNTSSQVLSQPDAAYSSLQFQWTDPNYQFSNGVSTQDVYYTMQIDTVGANGPTFSGANVISLPFTAQVSTSFTVKALDDVLGQMQLKTGVSHNYAFRIMATLASNGTPVTESVPVYSNVVDIAINPYLDVVYPVPANLYITGSATQDNYNSDGGWMVTGEPTIAGQTFTKTNPYTFVLTGVQLTGGKEYLFVPVFGDWTHKYAFPTADGNNPSGDVFVPDAPGNFIAPATTGSYTITVNFVTGKFSVQ